MPNIYSIVAALRSRWVCRQRRGTVNAVLRIRNRENYLSKNLLLLNSNYAT